MVKRIREFAADTALSLKSRLTLCSLLILATLFVLFSLISSQRVYAIEDNGKLKIHTANTEQLTITDIMEEKGVVITGSDYVLQTTAATSMVYQTFQVVRPYPVYIKVGGRTLQTETEGESVLSILNRAGIQVGNMDVVTPAINAPSSSGMVISVTRQSKGHAEEFVSIPYDVVYSDAKDIARGTVKEVTAGVPGQRKLVYETVLKDGEEVSRRLISDSVVKKPVNAKRLRGTGGVLVISRFREGFAKAPENVTSLSYSRVLTCNATAYTHTGYNTASGTYPRLGSVAVDPKVIKLGTKLYIVSEDGKWVYGYCVAEDTGGAIKGNKVDLFFNTNAECIQFGRRKVLVYVLD